MVRDETPSSGNSAMRIWVGIAILALLGIVLATQFDRIKTALSQIVGKDPEVDEPNSNALPSLRQFDLSGGPAAAEFSAVADDYVRAEALATEAVPADHEDARFVSDGDLVIGVAAGDAACAFPITLMRHHLVANHTLGGQSLVITYSPLTSSSAVYVNNTSGPFAPTNQVYNNALLIHDTHSPTPTVYSHFTGEALAGPDAGKSLTPHPHQLTTWGRWKTAHPSTTVVKRDESGRMGYGINPYSAYVVDVSEPYYPYANRDNTLPWNQQVLGLRVGKSAIAYPLAALKQAGRPVQGTLEGKKFTIEYFEDTPDQGVAVVTSADEGVVSQPSMWFAWKSFYPETTLPK